jgi:hypothetical protein
LNSWTNLYETWYVYHGTWAHLNDVLHKSLHQSVCVCVCMFVFLLMLQGNGLVKCTPPFCAAQWLGKHVLVAMNTRNNRRIVGHVVSMWSMSVHLFLYPPLIYARRLMRSLCCLCPPLIFSFSIWSVLYQRKVGN